MDHYNQSSHTVFENQYHLVWITKYRYPVLTGKLAHRVVDINDIDHTKTKAKHPQTNGICERFHKTILQEFYQVTFRKKLYETLDQLQADLDEWLNHYNTQRNHQGGVAKLVEI